MRVGLVVDSACDLPQSYIQDNGIVIMPITIRNDGKKFIDVRDPVETRNFYRQHLADSAQSETAPLSVEEIKRLFLDRLVIDYDFVFCLTIASSRSPIYENATQASYSILSEYKPIRMAAGHNTPFALRVVDTGNVFAGQGVMAAVVAKMIREGASPHRIRERLEQLLPQLWGYMLPSSLFHLRARAAKKGDKSVGWLQYAVGSALDIKPLIRGHRNETGPVAKLRHYDEGAKRVFNFIGDRIRAGLLEPTICISYGGELEELYQLPGYAQMADVAAAHKVELLASTLSITGVINVGEGSVTVAFFAPDHEFE